MRRREPINHHHPPTDNSEPTFLIDTPGVKGFGLVDLTQAGCDRGPVPGVPSSVEGFECRFGNCKHMKEPGCAVLEAPWKTVRSCGQPVQQLHWTWWRAWMRKVRIDDELDHQEHEGHEEKAFRSGS
jgi:hypothetical protein